MEPDGADNTTLYSQPIIACKQHSGGEIDNGQGYLLVANISNREKVITFTGYNMDGQETCLGSLSVNPGKIEAVNTLVGGSDSNKYMYYKISFKGSPKDIRASFIMQTVEGPPGSEVFTPVYAVTLS